MSTIPASALVSITPNVLSAGGSALDMNGLMLTSSTRIPIGAVAEFTTPEDVDTYFGSSSAEAAAADVYFNGFDNSNVKPGTLLMAQYNTAAVSAFLRGGRLGLTLTQLKAIAAGTIALTVNGTLFTSASINLSGATSFSNAAALILAGFTAPTFTVTYDTTADAFVFTTTLTGATATITAATASALSTSLLLTTVAGAVISQGAAIAVPGTFMDALVILTQNWATFMTIFDPDTAGQNTVKLAFAAWTNGKGDRYGYVCWDTDASPKTSAPATGSLGYLIAQAGYSGICVISAPTNDKAAFICGAAASIDFTEKNGRITFAFKGQSGLTADVTDSTTANNLIANGYNFYGAYATANQLFRMFQPGAVSGDFLWFDSFINEIWLTNAFQLALIELMVNVKSLPYNPQGYSLVEAACADPIAQGVNFGAIRAGVTLSAAQIAEVDAAAGVKISDTLSQRGWYLQVLDATAQVRQARGSPPAKFWYMDGESIQKINLTSVTVQ